MRFRKSTPDPLRTLEIRPCKILPQVRKLAASKIRQYLPTGRVGHLQIAGVPERHEPDLGELNYPYLFALIDSLGYTGVIGAEYRPRAATSAGLGWFQPYKKDR